MNEFEAWEQITKEWRRVQRRERLNQERLYGMGDRIHAVGDEINNDKQAKTKISPTSEHMKADTDKANKAALISSICSRIHFPF
jgi:hypothetical protein